MIDDDHNEFGGLHRDLLQTGATMDRRQLLRTAAKFGVGLGALSLFGCTSTSATDIGGGNGACTIIPQETAGPYPGDASNGPNVLNQTGVVRNDIRSSFAGLSGTADGVPLNIELTIVSASTCAPLAGYAVYLWHCDRLGRYSLYTSGVTNQNYLRGVQGADANGNVSFTTIFPACYAGRWPHIHFEVYRSLDAATNVSNKIATSQLALPKATCDLVYATTGYAQSITNLSQVAHWGPCAHWGTNRCLSAVVRSARRVPLCAISTRCAILLTFSLLLLPLAGPHLRRERWCLVTHNHMHNVA